MNIRVVHLSFHLFTSDLVLTLFEPPPSQTGTLSIVSHQAADSSIKYIFPCFRVFLHVSRLPEPDNLETRKPGTRYLYFLGFLVKFLMFPATTQKTYAKGLLMKL